MSWERNTDGVYVPYGTAQATVAVGGSPAQSGEFKTLEYNFTYANLNAHTVADTILGTVPHTYIPAGAHLVSATLYVNTAFDSGGSATLDIGAANEAGTVTSNQGIDAAIAESAIDTAGKSVACDGALVGTILAADTYISMGVNTATFTTGEGTLIFKYFVPST